MCSTSEAGKHFILSPHMKRLPISATAVVGLMKPINHLCVRTGSQTTTSGIMNVDWDGSDRGRFTIKRYSCH